MSFWDGFEKNAISAHFISKRLNSGLRKQIGPHAHSPVLQDLVLGAIKDYRLGNKAEAAIKVRVLKDIAKEVKIEAGGKLV